MSENVSSKRKYVIFAILGSLIIALDQWTKVMAREALKGGVQKTVIDGFFDLRFSENTGVAFGLLQNMPGGKWVLTGVAILALGLVIYYLHQTLANQLRVHVALGLIGGGAIGNLIDRVAYGRVTDFIVWRYKQHEWPAFNIADAALVVGVALMMIDMIRAPREAPAQRPVTGEEQPSRSEG
jgi:signal peptidase II